MIKNPSLSFCLLSKKTLFQLSAVLNMLFIAPFSASAGDMVTVVENNTSGPVEENFEGILKSYNLLEKKYEELAKENKEIFAELKRYGLMSVSPSNTDTNSSSISLATTSVAKKVLDINSSILVLRKDNNCNQTGLNNKRAESVDATALSKKDIFSKSPKDRSSKILSSLKNPVVGLAPKQPEKKNILLKKSQDKLKRLPINEMPVTLRVSPMEMILTPVEVSDGKAKKELPIVNDYPIRGTVNAVTNLKEAPNEEAKPVRAVCDGSIAEIIGEEGDYYKLKNGLFLKKIYIQTGVTH